MTGADAPRAGLVFPFRVDHLGGFALAREDDHIEQSIGIVLDTAPGQRAMRPDFGCALHDITFETIDTSTLRPLEKAIRAALERWEPRVDVLDVSFDVSAWQEGHLRVAITYRVNATGRLRTVARAFAVCEEDAP